MLTDPVARRRSDRPAADRPARQFWLSAAIFGLVWATAAVLLTTRWLDASQKQLVSDVLLVFCPLPGLLYTARTARMSRGRLQKAWWSFAGTLASWEAGNLVWFYYQFIADHQPYPTVGDAFYVLALICAAVGLALFPSGRARADGRARLALDALSIGCALLLASDVLVLHEVLGAMGTGLGAIVFVTYPVGDVILASMAILLLTRSHGRPRADLVLVAIGLLVYAAGDTAYALLGARGQFQMGTPVDLAWLAGYLLVGHAALTPGARQEDHRSLRHAGTNLTGALFVYVIVIGAAILALHDGSGDPVEYVLGGTLVGSFVLRQMVLTRDNRKLHASLEKRVAMRTAQLDGLARRHRGILDAVGEGIYEVDTGRRVTFVNTAAARLLGYEGDELIGQDAHALFHDERVRPEGGMDGTCPSCHLTAAIYGGEVVRSSEASYVRRGGERFPVDLTAAPGQDESGVSGAVVIFSDISERRALERMKEEFISMVSHELRTPLTAIRGSLGLIAGGAVGDLPAEAGRMVNIALNNSERLTRLINDLLDLERMQSGAIPIDFGVHDTADLVESTLGSVHAVADAAGVHVVRGPVRGTVHGDADRLVQALTNLIGNAVKFSPRGGSVEVSAEPEGAHVTFTVSDRGRGIPKEKMDAVFERFQQVDSSDAREKGGTGLGLAITKSIIERHGGQISVESDLGRGSTFRFTIPAVLAPGGAADRLDGQVLDAPTVLICDDDPDILEILGSLLSRHGYATSPVARGRDAIDLAIERHPDVILLDLRMPGMTGWEAISELKARPETRDIPIVIMSGLGPDADPELAERTDGWLTKPVEEPRIAEVLMNALRGTEDPPPTVLVVEDDHDLASLLVMMFEREGFATLRAATQHEATTLLRQRRPDVLVLDIYLPDGDGYGVIDALRAGGRGGTVPVIVYSAHQLDAASRQRLRLGEMVFMTKGRDAPQDLVQRVVDVVHSMARHTPAGATTGRGTGGVTTDTPGRR